VSLRVGIVGCGLIGCRRAETAAASGDRVSLVADIDVSRAESLAATHRARAAADWSELVASPDVDAVVVATINSALVEIATAAMEAGKHVLCEKPFGTTAEEAGLLLGAADAAGTVVQVGFTLRHHEAIERAHGLAMDGSIGKPIAIRAAYGHGGRAGYENEWRGDPALAGGGELLDQGVHLLDLARWFLGEFVEVSGALSTWGWPVEPLEDNAFAMLRTDDGRVAVLHTSWTQWRNLFRFELLGTEGLLVVEGLGGSYGPERLVFDRRRSEGGVPDRREWTVSDPSAAWTAEWQDFVRAIATGGRPRAGARDGYEAARLVDAVYVSARDAGVVRLLEAATR
jgi:predicted dehydrogenase